MSIRITEAEARRLAEKPQDAPRRAPRRKTPPPAPASVAGKAASANRKCVECGAIVGKGRRAVTCAPCDLVALLARAGLPAPVRELQFAWPERRYRADLAYPSLPFPLLIEVDGGSWRAGGGRHGGDEDKYKLSLAAALNYRVMHFSPQQIAADPAGCVALVRRALGL